MLTTVFKIQLHADVGMQYLNPLDMDKQTAKLRMPHRKHVPVCACTV